MAELQKMVEDVQGLLRASRLCLWYGEMNAIAVPIRSHPSGWMAAPVLYRPDSDDVMFSTEPADALALLPLSVRAQLQGEPVAAVLSARRPLDAQRTVGLYALWQQPADLPAEAPRLARDILGTVGQLLWRLGTSVDFAENHPQMHALASALPQGVVIVPVDSRLGYVNAAAAELLALPAGEARPDLLAERLQQLVQRARNGGEVAAFASRVLGQEPVQPRERTAVWRFVDPPRALRVTISPIRTPRTQAWAWLLDDVSRETALQDELANNELKFRQFYQSLRDTVVFYDMAGQPVECNQALYELLGLPGPGPTALTPAALGWDAGSWARLTEECLRTGHTPPRERKLQAAGGRTVHAESSAYLRRDAEGRARGVWEVLHDITERKNVEAQLILSAEAFARHTEGVLLTDADSVILTANDAFVRTSGYSREELRGQRPNLLKSGKHDQRFYEQMRRAISEHGWWQGGVWNRHRNGELFFKWLTVNSVRDAQGTLTHYIGTYRDPVAVRTAQRHIEYLATHDQETQLPNAILFEDRIQSGLQRLRGGSGQLGLVIVEVQGMTRISNALGVSVGEQVIKDAAERLRGTCIGSLAVARLAKEQFGVLIEADHAGTLAHHCARILEALNPPYLHDDQPVAAPVAIGVSTFPLDGEDSQTLLIKANTALGRARAMEVPGYQFFAAELGREISESFALESGLRQALAHDEFFLEYQAQVSSRDGTVAGCEALVRWRRGETTVPPAVFIPVAEASNLIVPLTEWVLGQACRDLRQWDAHGVTIPTVSVNISARHFQLDTMVERLTHIVAEEGLAPTRICLEITEGALAEPEHSETKLRALRQAGFALSVDDFGTGYSSLSYLRRFALDELKIDRSFVRGIEGDPGDRALANAILAMARSLQLTTVAEGVETEQQRRYLAEHGCDLIQGYLFMRPSDAGTLERYARERSSARPASVASAPQVLPASARG